MGCASSSSEQTLGEKGNDSFLKFKPTRLGNARPSILPQLVIARIGQINSDLESPYSQKKCALYRIDLQKRQSNGDWEDCFTETDSADFILMDPDSTNNFLHVNCPNSVLLHRVREDELHQFELLSSRETSASTLNFLARAGADSKHLEKYRIREVVYEYNSQLAVFGIVKEDATVMNIISPASHESIPADVRTKNKWTSADEKYWNQLAPTNTEPCLIFADDPTLFQGQIVKSLKGMKVNLPPELSQYQKEDENISNQIRRPVAASRIFVQLPANSEPGTQVRVPGPDGNSMLIDVPMDYTPGQVVELMS